MSQYSMLVTSKGLSLCGIIQSGLACENTKYGEFKAQMTLVINTRPSFQHDKPLPTKVLLIQHGERYSTAGG